MELPIVRRIRENVHGTVDVTALENRIIDHPAFQRLRRIRQLAFLSYVFPGATHTRFEHSLGVMQLASATWHKMAANQRRLANSCARISGFGDAEKTGVGGLVHGLLAPTFEVAGEVFASSYTHQALRLAGLLHDLGHPPFSHSGERFLPSYGAVLRRARAESPGYLGDAIERRCDKLAAAGLDPGKATVRHEIFTLLLVERVVREVVESFKGHAVSPRDIVAIIAPEITPEENGDLSRFGVHRLCHELISGELDIDRMDYLLRDSRECGVVYGIFDATRIQDSLTMYFDPRDAGLHLAINLSGLAAFEDYLRARHSMYLQVYFHKTAVGAEAMMQALARRLGGYSLPDSLDAYMDLDEYNIEGALADAARTLEDQAAANAFRATLADLLRHRRLWKRVFEVAVKDKTEGARQLAAAAAVVKAMGVPYETISSSSSLTSFRPRQGGEHSRNYLRLIKKDAYQFPRVMPIEDHTPLVAEGERVHISRMYVEDTVAADGQRATIAVRERLRETLAPKPAP